MGLFDRRKPEEERAVPAEDPAVGKARAELEGIISEIKTRRSELDGMAERMKTVSEEYDGIVGNLMLVKKELNEKRIELDVIQQEHASAIGTMRGSKESDAAREPDMSEEDLAKLREETSTIAGEYDTIQQRLAKEQSKLPHHKKAADRGKERA